MLAIKSLNCEPVMIPEFSYQADTFTASHLPEFKFLTRVESVLLYEDHLLHQVLLEAEATSEEIERTAMVYPVDNFQREDIEFVLEGYRGYRGRFRESKDPYVSNERCWLYSIKHDFFFAGEGSLYQPEAEVMASLWEILGFGLASNQAVGFKTAKEAPLKWDEPNLPPEFSRPTDDSRYLGLQFVWPTVRALLEKKLDRGCSPPELCRIALAGYIWSDEIQNGSLQKLDQEEYDQIWGAFPEVLGAMVGDGLAAKGNVANSDLIHWGLLTNFHHWFTAHEPRVLSDPLWNKAMDLASADLSWHRD
jgi:hypothetical protein